MRLRTWFLPSILTLAACGGSSSEPSFPSTPSTAAASPANAGPTVDTNYRTAWKKPQKWTRGVAITAWGDPVVVIEKEIHVLDRSTGRSLESHELSCNPISKGALGVVGDARVAVVCDQGVAEVTTPGLASKKAFSLEAGKGHVIGASFAGDRVALAVETPEVRLDAVIVVDTKTWSVVDTVEVQGNVTDAALSADGTMLAFGGPLQGIAVRSLDSKTTKVLAEGDGSSVVRALAFASGNAELFATRSGEPEVFNVETKARRALSSMKTVDYARYLTSKVVAAFGADGLVLAEDGRSIAQIGNPEGAHTGLDVSRDNSYICALTDSEIACYSTKPQEASTYKPSAANASNPSSHDPMSDSLATAPANNSPKKPPPVVVNGTVTGLQANIVTLSVTNPGPLKVGGKATLLSRPPNAEWLEIGRLTIKEIKGNKVTVELTDDPAMVEIDGRQINPYKNGSQIRVQLDQP